MKLQKLRAARLHKDKLCAVDSTSRSAYGKSITDIRWGKNKESLSLEQTVEVVVYTLDSHMPIYWRIFPGNMQDCRSLETILTDLQHAGFTDVILVTDRGYEKIRNLETYILDEGPDGFRQATHLVGRRQDGKGEVHHSVRRQAAGYLRCIRF